MGDGTFQGVIWLSLPICFRTSCGHQRWCFLLFRSKVSCLCWGRGGYAIYRLGGQVGLGKDTFRDIVCRICLWDGKFLPFSELQRSIFEYRISGLDHWLLCPPMEMSHFKIWNCYDFSPRSAVTHNLIKNLIFFSFKFQFILTRLSETPQSKRWSTVFLFNRL